MRRMLVAMGLLGLAIMGACSDDETTEPGTGTGTATGTATGTGTGTGTGSGTATGAGTPTGIGGGGGQGGDGGSAGGGGGGTHPLCAAVSGQCTDARWVMCPNGTEPVEPDPNQDCPGSEGTQGWCCVDAPASSCSDESSGMCVVGESCQGCFAPVAGYTCEQGRVCCQDICD